ncbi:intersectin-2-like [Tropilaelaps mercedesae]|uniref:Intersectin-2-like n=1 Tax=Tropilaelaps mercedesae TaxID=418985 RepID=A0A1V9XRR9_9ACAR|nr:intersectin-2-like [Tropilaelaps mercedesae]
MDIWTIPPEMRAKYDAQFEIIQQGGAVTGDVAKALFLKSGLPAEVLAKIWALADMDADGRIDKKEFSIALWLIAMKLKGIEVPERLPVSMLAPPPRPPPSTDPFSSTGAAPPRPGPPPPLPPAPAPSAMASPIATQAAGRVGGPPPKPPPPTNVPPPKPVPPAIPPAPQVAPTSAIGVTQPGEWAVPQQTKLKYTQLFNQHDRQRTGFLTGNQTRGILMQTGLPNAVLAQIWYLSDIDTDGRLTSEEFVLAMHLCELSRSGQQLSATLPVDLVPPSYRRKNSGARHDSAGSVSSAGSRGLGGHETLVSPPVTQENVDLIGGIHMGHATFEDKRRENFEKGQAELERRRQIILEQQRREQQERERKEREEMQRREKMRQEQERKRQEELEAERERQRQRAEELEAERKRMQEQKEAARKEMERQRELELQRQRIIEMTALKQRTQEGLSLLKRRKLDLCLQVERLSREVGEVNGKIAAQREEVATAKAFIDGMRPQRDERMAELSEVKARLKECSDEALLLNQEKLNMQNQLASLKSKAGNKQREFETKIEMARKQLQQLGNEIKNKTAEVEKAEKEVEDKENAKNAANHVDESVWGGAPAPQENEASTEDPSKPEWNDPTSVDWGDETPKAAPAVPPPPTQATIDAWGEPETTTATFAQESWRTSDASASWAGRDRATTSGDPGKEDGVTKYRALFEFEARNEDELSFQPGDIIKVTLGEQGEPGWLAGELRGKSGWFPESYVEPANGGSTTATSWDLAPAEAEVRSTPLDTVQEEPGSGEGEIVCYALYSYDSAEPGDLCFPIGAAIKVTQKNGDWWTGSYNGTSGIFPGNYVSTEKPADTEPESAPAGASPAVVQTNAEDGRQPDSANGKRSSTQNDSNKSMKKKPEIVMVVANYEASGDGQLSLVKGQLVQVRKKTDGGWWEGEIHQKGKGRKIGWFPASYVKVLAGPGAVGNSAPGATAPATTPALAQEASSEPVQGEKVKAVFEFQGQQDDELTFGIDEIIVVTNKDDPSWWKGYKTSDASSKEGLFPSNYVEALCKNGAVAKRKVGPSLNESQKISPAS